MKNRKPRKRARRQVARRHADSDTPKIKNDTWSKVTVQTQSAATDPADSEFVIVTGPCEFRVL